MFDYFLFFTHYLLAASCYTFTKFLASFIIITYDYVFFFGVRKKYLCYMFASFFFFSFPLF